MGESCAAGREDRERWTKVALLVGRQSDDGCCTAGWESGGQTVIGRMLGGWERAALLVGKVGKEVEDKGCPVD